jgi:acetyl-CoA carboxylase alpha subunit
MLEHAVYSVITPEGCAAILWRDAARAPEAAAAMKITASDLASFGLVDVVVPEPAGGAQTDPESLFRSLDEVVDGQLRELSALPPAALVDARYEKFRRMGHLGGEFLETT